MDKVKHENLMNWLETRRHLPGFLKEDDDQNTFFRRLQETQEEYNADAHVALANSSLQNQCFVIDIFLWFCAKRGYTLQRSRTANIEFYDMGETMSDARDSQHEHRMQAVGQFLASNGPDKNGNADNSIGTADA